MLGLNASSANKTVIMVAFKVTRLQHWRVAFNSLGNTLT